jgi:hypothetical protein
LTDCRRGSPDLDTVLFPDGGSSGARIRRNSPHPRSDHAAAARISRLPVLRRRLARLVNILATAAFGSFGRRSVAGRGAAAGLAWARLARTRWPGALGTLPQRLTALFSFRRSSVV